MNELGELLSDDIIEALKLDGRWPVGEDDEPTIQS